MTIEAKLEQGIAAAKAGNKQEARAVLAEIVESDETQLEAWLWLSQVVDSLEEKEICLDNILTLDPDNDFAQQELAWVKAEQEKLYAPVYAPGEEEPPPPAVSAEPDAVEIPAEAEPPDSDEFDDEWLCPYCLAPTQPDNRHCPTCGRSLIIRTRITSERTPALWRGITLQFVIVIFLVAAGASVFTILFKVHGFSNPAPFLPLYFGLSVGQPGNSSQTIFAIFPPWLFWSFVGATLYSFVLMLMLYFRLPYGHFFYLVNAGMMLAAGAFSLIFYFSTLLILGLSVIVLFIGATQLLITMTLWNDFTFKEARLRLKIDRGVKNHTSLSISARKYARLGMWGLAVIHLRRAIARKSDIPAYHTGLATAYMKVKRYDLAEKSLERAEQLAPNTAELWQLRRQLGSLTQSNR